MRSIVSTLAWLSVSWVGSDWPRWRGPEGTGISGETAAGFKPKWKQSVGDGHSAVSVVGKRLYTMGNQGGTDIVHCLDAESGKPIWRFPYACPAGSLQGPRATPVVDGGLVYTLSRNGHALCLDAETGRVKWQKDLIREYRAVNITYGLSGSPLVAGNAVIYNARAGGIALDKSTGEKIWEGDRGPCGYATPVLFTHQGKECVAIYGFMDVLVVDAGTGQRLYSFSWGNSTEVNAADPVYFEGKLFVTSGWGRGCALLDLSGAVAKPLWENRNLSGQFASPIYLAGHIYGIDGISGEGQLRCLDARTGNVRWTQRGGCENFMVAGGKIIALDKQGTLIVCEADPSAYKEISRTAVLSKRAKNWIAPVLANGLLYCRNSDGDLVCLDAR